MLKELSDYVSEALDRRMQSIEDGISPEPQRIGGLASPTEGTPTVEIRFFWDGLGMVCICKDWEKDSVLGTCHCQQLIRSSQLLRMLS